MNPDFVKQRVGYSADYVLQMVFEGRDIYLRMTQIAFNAVKVQLAETLAAMAKLERYTAYWVVTRESKSPVRITHVPNASTAIQLAHDRPAAIIVCTSLHVKDNPDNVGQN